MNRAKRTLSIVVLLAGACTSDAEVARKLQEQERRHQLELKKAVEDVAIYQEHDRGHSQPAMSPEEARQLCITLARQKAERIFDGDSVHRAARQLDRVRGTHRVSPEEQAAIDVEAAKCVDAAPGYR